MSFKLQDDSQPIDAKNALLNLTKILPVTEAHTLITKICPFFVYKEEMRNINKNFPIKYNINNSDPLGPFIESEYNKDENSYRSPWSNTYFPQKDSNKLLTKELRALEEKINMLIKLYLKIYYSPDAISSAYISFTDESISSGFNCCVIISSKINNSQNLDPISFLESTNIINVKFMKERSKGQNKELIKAIYKINTIFLYKIKIKNSEIEFNGTECCDCNKTTYIKDYFETKSHLEQIGKSIEENEGKLRLKLDKIYLEKNYFICNEIRTKDIENKNRVINLKNIYTEFEKYAAERKMKAEAKKNIE
jgi:capping protein beta